MPGSVIGERLPKGWPGTQSRSADAIIQARMLSVPDGATYDNVPFGRAMTLTNENTWTLATTGATADTIAGVTMRNVVQANSFYTVNDYYIGQQNGGFIVNTVCDVMTRGNMVVECFHGTPVSGAAVFVILTSTDEQYPQGGFVAEDPSASGVTISPAIPNIEWTTGYMDENRVAEITIKSRNKG